jgi:hypothetical protein
MDQAISYSQNSLSRHKHIFRTEHPSHLGFWARQRVPAPNDAFGHKHNTPLNTEARHSFDSLTMRRVTIPDPASISPEKAEKEKS